VKFIAPSDTWFRPVHATNGPGGTLYICDMYCEDVASLTSMARSLMPDGIEAGVTTQEMASLLEFIAAQ